MFKYYRIITVENTCSLLEVAKTYELKELEIKSLNLIDTNADQILASESFKKIHKDLLERILTRDTFNASSELSIFHAVKEWSKHANQNIENFNAGQSYVKFKIWIENQDFNKLFSEGLALILNATIGINETVIVLYFLKKGDTFCFFNKPILHQKLNLKNSSELSTFHAVKEWSKHANQNIENVIHLVKLPLIPLEELLQFRNSGTLTGDNIFDGIRSDNQKYEKLPEQNENVASSKYNVRTIQGVVENGHPIKYRHTIGDGSSITIELGQIFILNHLTMELQRYLYGYFIEISTDQKKWERIIDYSSYKCRSMQNLYFPSKPVKYVKIVGTRSPNNIFKIGKFEAYYREIIPEIRNGIVVPKEKVDYIVLRSGNRPKITLKQPYYIDSIRFEIDNQNSNRKYKFLIETSLNQRDWEKVADKRDEFVNGWQTFRFTLKPISLVRFIPTACNTDGALDTFRSKNFECPSSV